MHETADPRFKLNIESVNVIDHQAVVAGWLVCVDPPLTPSYSLGGVSFAATLPRPDVGQFYQTSQPNWNNCGFEVLIPLGTSAQSTLTASMDNEVVQLGVVKLPVSFALNSKLTPDLLAIDDFYSDPDSVREFALGQTFASDLRYFKGQRSMQRFLFPGIKERFETLLNTKITNWESHGVNGIFQFCTAEDALVYHSDHQRYAGAVYLTPNAPPQCGTSFWRSRNLPEVRRTVPDDTNYSTVFPTGHLDRTQFELVDTIGNVYNRLVIWDARLLHSASEYFGNNLNNSRLFHLFFFDIEE